MTPPDPADLLTFGLILAVIVAILIFVSQPACSHPVRVAPDDLRPMVDTVADSYSVPPSLIVAMVRVESAYNVHAHGASGEIGLMQLSKPVARAYDCYNRFDAMCNIRAGTAHLRDLINRYGGNVRLALAAYNAGASAVDRYNGVPPYPVTQDYVRDVADWALFYLIQFREQQAGDTE